MKNFAHKYKNSYKNDFMFNLVLILVSVVLTFAASKFFTSGIGLLNAKNGIIIYALAIVFAFSRPAIDAIEKLFCGKFSSQIVAIVSILLMFASKRYLAACVIAIIFSFCECVYNLILSDISSEYIDCEGELEYLVVTDTNYVKTPLSELKNGDLVLASVGDYLSFSYETQDSSGKIKTTKSGYFTLSESKVVKVVTPCDYDIDFDETCTSLGKTMTFVSYGICAVVAALALVLAFKSHMDGKSLQDCIYTFAKYILFATPFAYTSGITQVVYILKKVFAKKGVALKDFEDVQNISSIKKIFFAQKGIVTQDKPELKSVEVVDGYTKEDVLKYCAIANNDISSSLDNVFGEYLPKDTVTKNTSVINDVGIMTTYEDVALHFGTKAFMDSSRIDTQGLPEYTAFIAIDKKVIGTILLKDNLNENAVKAAKIAKVYKLSTALLSADCKENVRKIDSICDFDECYDSMDSNEVAQTLYMYPKHTAAYISQDVAESKDVFTVSTAKSARTVKPESLVAFVKAISHAKLFSIFAYVRIAISFLVNVVFAFVVYKNMFVDKLIYKFTTSTTAMEAHSSDFSIKEIIHKAVIYNDELAPWLIALVQIVLVIVFVLIAVMFDEKQPQKTEENE